MLANPLARQVAFLAGLAGLALLTGMVIALAEYDVQGYLLVALALLTLMALVVAPRMAAGESSLFFSFVISAFFLKAGASIFRIIWGFDVKGGAIDAGRYHQAGERLFESIRQLDFSLVTLYLQKPGTSFVEGFTGIVYSIIGPTLYGGFLLFAFFAFLGSCLYYKAFRTAFPEGNRWLYAGLIFLYPSWLYWPSSIGKDSLLAFTIALTVWSVVVFFRNKEIKALVFLAIGLIGVFMVRPHVAALLITAIAAAFALRPYHMGAAGPFVRIALIVIGIIGISLIINKAAPYVRLDEMSVEAVLDQYEDFQGRSRGGSAFEPISIVSDPLGVPKLLFTVLFRPFPWEAHRGAALVLSLEGLVFLGLVMWRFRSIKAALVNARSDPYLIFMLVYMVLFVLVFSSIFVNFSILGRQRLQFLPLMFMLVAYAAGPGKRETPAPVKRRRKRVPNAGASGPISSRPTGGVSR